MSSRQLNDLQLVMQPLAEAFLVNAKAAGIDLIVTCTWRTNTEQAALYAQGRTTPGKIVTNAKAGESAHNYRLAMDVVPLVNGKPDWDGAHPVWQQIGAIGQSCGLEWLGAPGSPFREQAHFQYPNWRSLREGTP